MATTTAAAGVSNKQLADLTAGGWVDVDSSYPSWERWVMVADGRRFRQVVYPELPSAFDWRAISDGVLCVFVQSLEEALRCCDNLAEGCEIADPVGEATRQTDRFTK